MKKATIAVVAVTVGIAIATSVALGLSRTWTPEKPPTATYPAERVAREMCDHYLATYKDGGTLGIMLYCDPTKPTATKGNVVVPGSMFTLVQMRGLCPPDGKPGEIDGKLTCVDQSGTCPAGTFPRALSEKDASMVCKPFLKLFGEFQ